jgi:hypothetical protein
MLRQHVNLTCFPNGKSCFEWLDDPLDLATNLTAAHDLLVNQRDNAMLVFTKRGCGATMGFLNDVFVPMARRIHANNMGAQTPLVMAQVEAGTPSGKEFVDTTVLPNFFINGRRQVHYFPSLLFKRVSDGAVVAWQHWQPRTPLALLAFMADFYADPSFLPPSLRSGPVQESLLTGADSGAVDPFGSPRLQQRTDALV